MAVRVGSLCTGLVFSSVAGLSAGSGCMLGAEETCRRDRTPTSSGSVLLQYKSSQDKLAKRVVEEACTSEDKDPWATGHYTECCDGATKKLGPWEGSNGRWHYKCVAVENEKEDVDEECTQIEKDPYASGSFVQCCDGLQKHLVETAGRWHYVCQSQPADEPQKEDEKEEKKEEVTTPVVTSTTEFSNETSSGDGDATRSRMLQWNVHYKNRDFRGMANVVIENNVDIVGLCELTGGNSPEEMAGKLSHASKRDFRIQPGRDHWYGFGTDIFYDHGKWEALEGGVSSAQCWRSRGGNRAVNWVVLQERKTSQKLIVGGTHTSYCREGCDYVHECELMEMYKKFEDMKEKHDAPVVWMGDINRNMRSRIMSNVVKGKVGSQNVFPVDDLVQTPHNTYYTGGSAIDHIMGESGKFLILDGGRTNQGVRGRHLYGADHFPVFADVEF